MRDEKMDELEIKVRYEITTSGRVRVYTDGSLMGTYPTLDLAGRKGSVMTWNVCCQVTRRVDGWDSSRQVQLFNLNPDFVGRNKERVISMAQSIVNPYNDQNITVHVTAELVHREEA
jgi:hypothetical protein